MHQIVAFRRQPVDAVDDRVLRPPVWRSKQTKREYTLIALAPLEYEEGEVSASGSSG
jgi:hypothetical protein